MGNFPGLISISEGDHEHWQDAVCASHGVQPLVEFLQNRFAVPRRCESAFFVGGRALSSHGFCAVDLARISSRHRGKLGGKPQQALRYGVSLPDQEKYACGGQREQVFENLGPRHQGARHAGLRARRLLSNGPRLHGFQEAFSPSSGGRLLCHSRQGQPAGQTRLLGPNRSKHGGDCRSARDARGLHHPRLSRTHSANPVYTRALGRRPDQGPAISPPWALHKRRLILHQEFLPARKGSISRKEYVL
jgi:hypothetical protein